MSRTYILVKDKERIYKIENDNIMYITSEGSKTILYIIESKLPTDKLLKQWEEDLPKERFYRINRQVIINLDYLIILHKIGNASVIMTNQAVFRVSRRRLSGLKKLLK